jgi:O-antigen/teichoic acid export membrane protein
MESPQDQHADAKDITKGAAVNLLGEIAKGLKPAYLAVITRLYGVEAFGLYSLGWALIDLMSHLGTFGLDKGLIRFLPQHRKEKDPAAGAHEIIAAALVIGLIASLIVTLLVFLCAPVFSTRIFHKPSLTPVLKIFCLAIPLLMLLKILLAATQAVRIMRFTFYVRSLVEPAIWFTAAVIFYYLSLPAAGLAWAHVFSIAGSVLVAAYFFGRILSLRQCASRMTRLSSWRRLARFSLPLSLRDPLAILISRLDVFMVAYFLPVAEVGLYAIIVEIANVTRKVRHSFVPIFMPVASDLIHRGDSDRLRNSFSFVVRWILNVNIAFFAVICLAGRDILAIFGPEFVLAATSLIVLCLGHLISTALDPAEIVLLMAGRTYLCLLDLCLLLAINVILDIFLIPLYGLVGAAMGAAISLVAINLVRMLQVYLLLHIQPFKKAVLKPVLAGGLAFLPTLFAIRNFSQDDYWRLISSVVLFLVTYVAVLFWFKREPEDKEIENKVREKLGGLFGRYRK